MAGTRAIQEHGAPAFLRSDNGPEFIAKEVQRWLAENQIKTIYIDPGSPWQNGFVESFHGRLGDKCLNQEVLWTLTEARVVVVADFRHHDNHARLHGKLGYQSPVRLAAQNPRLALLVGTGQLHPIRPQANQPQDSLTRWIEKAGLVKPEAWSSRLRARSCLLWWTSPGGTSAR